MASNEDPQPSVPAGTPAGAPAPENGRPHPAASPDPNSPAVVGEEEVYGYPTESGRDPEDPYESGAAVEESPPAETPLLTAPETTAVPATQTGSTPPAPPQPPASGPPAAPPPSGPTEDDDDDGMLRMSFLEHLEELRRRILHALMGLGVAFFACIYFSYEIWGLISRPATAALKSLGYEGDLVFTTPMEAFTTIWVKVPMLTAVFVGSPWILYQVWAFIAPGLYRRERRWAAPFVIFSAGLFVLGGLFAYFVAFRFGLTFLLGIGKDVNVRPMVTISEYFDLFVNVTLGVGLVFEMPILIFFLNLLRVVTPAFLIRHSRYAILIITAVAAIVTPTPDVFNMMLFATPMCLLYYVGIFAGYIAVTRRDTGRYPWKVIGIVLGIPIVLVGAALAVAILVYGYHFTQVWPFLVR